MAWDWLNYGVIKIFPFNASIFDGKTVLNTEYGYLIWRYLQDEAKLAGLRNCSRIWAQAGQSQSSLHEHMIGYENKGQSDNRCMITNNHQVNDNDALKVKLLIAFISS